MEKIIALGIVLMGWLFLFAMILTLAHLRAKRNSLGGSRFRLLKDSRPFDFRPRTCHTPRDRQIPA